MGVLPLQFFPGDNAEILGLTGHEEFTFAGLDDTIEAAQKLMVLASRPDGTTKKFQVISRLDSKIEIDYYRNSGILQYMLRQLSSKHKA
jgi:aconitate hydratase